VAGWKSACSIGRIRWFAQVDVKPLSGSVVELRRFAPARARGMKQKGELQDVWGARGLKLVYWLQWDNRRICHPPDFPILSRRMRITTRHVHTKNHCLFGLSGRQ
jgi:hypothetical protein